MNTIKSKHSYTIIFKPNMRSINNMAKDLKKRGFSFVGTTICYAFMQAVGMINDHTTLHSLHHLAL